ncbi:MAG: transposase [Candidatus Omnitrophica bacterium]|nr:transposase [Candidatus Omnitrophota bacterium]
MGWWTTRCAWVLTPLYEWTREVMLLSDIVLSDDTPVNMLEPKSLDILEMPHFFWKQSCL